MTEREIFIVALDKEGPAARQGYLDDVCAGQSDLRKAVEELLRMHDESGSFMANPALAPGVTGAFVSALDRSELSVAEGPGTRIGPYKLLQQIGEGGFGVVYMAEQTEPVRRMVALKIIKAGMDTALVIARFESERQALALMDHPHIARVLDAGATTSGRPYFVMELVKGVPITEFCDKNHLAPEGRLRLFIDVCHAIQHAHHKGVIHRDIKPSNVMVTLHDGVPVVKVIDFGVAKATVQKLTEKTLFTAYGQMIGTPAYMSPEQAEMSGLDIDTRSDVYSLGVLLYELLTGTTPLECKRLREAGYVEMQRLIREEEAPRPSTRLSSLGGSATVLAGNRGLDVKQLVQLLSGDVDWIVMKALEKDRSRRYSTPGGFAEDIERYLRHEAILARPPSTTYKLRKFAQRNRTAVLTAAGVAVALLAGTAIATWQAVRATRAEAQAIVERDEKEQARKKAEDFVDRLRQATALVGDAIALMQQRRWSSAHAVFARAEELQPDFVAIYIFRAALYESLGLWERAAADHVKKIELVGRKGWDSGAWYRYILLRWQVGDVPGHEQECRLMLERFGEASLEGHDNPDLARLETVRACVLSPKPVAESADLARRAEQVVSRQPIHWHFYIAGLAHYRAGEHAQAVARLRRALDSDWNARAICYPCLAMAYHRLGQAAEGREALAAAEKAMDEWTEAMLRGPVGTMPIPWFDWLDARHFYREAKLLLTGSAPPDDPRLRVIRERALAALERP